MQLITFIREIESW